MVPYLKDMHRTLKSWRSGKNGDGWKLSLEELRELNIEESLGMSEDAEIPAEVKSVLRLKGDLLALRKLLAGEKHYRVPVRVTRNGLGCY